MSKMTNGSVELFASLLNVMRDSWHNFQWVVRIVSAWVIGKISGGASDIVNQATVVELWPAGPPFKAWCVDIVIQTRQPTWSLSC